MSEEENLITIKDINKLRETKLENRFLGANGEEDIRENCPPESLIFLGHAKVGAISYGVSYEDAKSSNFINLNVSEEEFNRIRREYVTGLQQPIEGISHFDWLERNKKGEHKYEEPALTRETATHHIAEMHRMLNPDNEYAAYARKILEHMSVALGLGVILPTPAAHPNTVQPNNPNNKNLGGGTPPNA